MKFILYNVIASNRNLTIPVWAVTTTARKYLPLKRLHDSYRRSLAR